MKIRLAAYPSVLPLDMEYRFIQGVRDGSQLLHVLGENMLYVHKYTRKGGKIYTCYQSILAAQQKEGNEEVKCSARVKILPNGECVKMAVSHSDHGDHGLICRDMDKRNNMKTACRTLKYQHPEDSHKISERHIYQREIAK